jgi:phosphopantetheine adenylyltransferase
MKIGQSNPIPKSTVSPQADDATQDSMPSNTTASVSKILSNLSINIQMISDPLVKKTMTVLLNLVERQTAKVAELLKKNQEQKDEINRLKGEQGKPKIKPSNKDGDISSEKDRKRRKKQTPRKKRESKFWRVK